MKRMLDSDFMLAIDIGTTKVCAIAARRNERKVIEILGIGLHPCSGLSASGIVDLEEIVISISNATNKAISHIPGVHPRKAVVSISGTYLQSQNCQGILNLSNHGRGVTQDDIQQSMNAAIKESVTKDFEVVHCIPRWFRLDDDKEIRDPLGMEGSVLEANIHLVTGRKSILRNIVRCVKRAGFNLENLVSQGIASSAAILTEDEKNTGVALINLGGETTSIVVYHGGYIQHSESLGLGGEDITQDINRYFQTPVENADHLKKYSGSARSTAIKDDDTMEVIRFKNRRTLIVKRKRLCEIIEARVEQILEEVMRSMRMQHLLDRLYGGIVLTGGTALLEGIPEKAQEIIKRDTHIGYPDGIVGYPDIINSPLYATAVGLLHYGFEKRDHQQAAMGTGFSRLYHRFFQWTQDTFQ
ncbi:MAG: cell division protein FtsA [bacterium]|jgi:cell division protein FtsA|nr:cell division protein FtsA [bacterium]